MASVRQADTALWLHNKLSTDDSWSGSSLRSLLTQDVLRNIPECFHRLETQVKVKLLMAFLHLPRRVMEETSSEMSEIFEIGSQDEDEWVRVLSEILKYYPRTGMLNVHLEHVSPVFAEVAEEIKKTVANLPDSGSSLLPLECLYLNRTALVAMVGPQPPLPKHFTLRRKPKSAALRAELTQKASEAMSAQKKGLGTSLSTGHKLQPPSKKYEAPVRVTPRMSNSSSFRPPPSRTTPSSGSSRSIISAATLKHHGRTKLLDINEQPIGGGRELKRRKKLAESEQGDEAKYKKLENPKTEPSTPDYAAGLAPVTQPVKPPSSPETPSSSMAPPSSTPSYAPQAASTQAPSADTLSESTINLKRELEMHMEQQRQLMIRERQQKQAAAAAAMAGSSTSSTTTPSVSDSTRTPAVPSPGATNNQQQQQQQQAKRQLTLTRDQMLAAHEMFKNANRVTRAEKALILGFMAGAREKPYSHQGPIITIKLSENTETVTAADGTQQIQLVEMLFEMNYDSGHWRRLKRTRVVSKNGASSTPAQKST